MEGQLKPGVHFIETRHDLTDLDEKLDWYNRYPDEAKHIITNTNQWASEFQDSEREDLIATLVLLRYTKLTENYVSRTLQPYLDQV